MEAVPKPEVLEQPRVVKRGHFKRAVVSGIAPV
jgi:hypothetical protein